MSLVCAAIWYNKTCRQNQLMPTYVNIRINGNNTQCQKTLKLATKCRITQEIKFLYIKKMKLNEQLYRLQLEGAKKWQALWPIIIQSIDDKLGRQMKTQYQNLNLKLDKLQKQRRKIKYPINTHNSMTEP